MERRERGKDMERGREVMVRDCEMGRVILADFGKPNCMTGA